MANFLADGLLLSLYIPQGIQQEFNKFFSKDENQTRSQVDVEVARVRNPKIESQLKRNMGTREGKRREQRSKGGAGN